MQKKSVDCGARARQALERRSRRQYANDAVTRNRRLRARLRWAALAVIGSAALSLHAVA